MDRQIMHTLGPVYKKSKHMSPKTLKHMSPETLKHENEAELRTYKFILGLDYNL